MGLLLFLAVAVGFNLWTDNSRLKVSIVGDIMLSRDVSYYLERFGYDYPYEYVSDLFLSDDFTIGNLECPITETNNPADKTKRFIFKADYENALALKNAGFDCLVLANNHTMDYLAEGLSDTMAALEANGLSYAGAVKNQASESFYIFRKKGIKIGLLAYSALPPEGFFYNEDKPSVMYISSTDFTRLDMDIALVKADCDFLIVYFHWGTEYLPYNSETQELIAKRAIYSGADFIVGAHPHVLQNSEMYMDKHIYYSLGNFIFDKQIPPGTDESIVLQLDISKKGLLGIEEIPVKIIDARPVYQRNETEEE